MPYSITSNRKNTSFVVHASGANVNLVIAGNSSVSNVATSNEILTGAYITQAIWGCDSNGYITILRGSDLVAVYDSSSQHDYAGCGMPISVGQSANLSINFIGSANCFVILECQKVGTFISEYVNP
jgi:hypothetical protein